MILVRNVLAGLQAVPADVREAARGMGFSPARLLVRVELPLALPAILAGLRIATVSTIELAVIGAIVGQGGFGAFIVDGFQRNLFRAEIMVGVLGSIGLAVVADLLLLGLTRLVTPWTRSRRERVVGRGRHRALAGRTASTGPVRTASPPGWSSTW